MVRQRFTERAEFRQHQLGKRSTSSFAHRQGNSKPALKRNIKRFEKFESQSGLAIHHAEFNPALRASQTKPFTITVALFCKALT